jgi:diguanylate cyclase
VAEGIEDRQTLARLVELGCGYGQGFLWSPALTPDDFFGFVQRRA